MRLSVAFVRNTAVFPERGPSIDVSPDGPLGPLWCDQPPSGCPPFHGNNDGVEQPLGENPSDAVTTSAQAAAIPTGSYPVSLPFCEGTTQKLPCDGYLFKYVSFDALASVLQTASLRFSPVSSFNDPFDGQLLPIRKFGWKHVFRGAREEVARLVTAKEERVYQLPADIPAEAATAAAANLMMEMLNSDRSVAISPAAFGDRTDVDSLSKLLRPMIHLAQQGVLKLDAINGILDLFETSPVQFSVHDGDRRMISGLADLVSVLCLTEVSDSTLMWAHYAEEHTGAVLKFDVCCENAGLFTAARPVLYEKSLPGFEQPRCLVADTWAFPSTPRPGYRVSSLPRAWSGPTRRSGV